MGLLRQAIAMVQLEPGLICELFLGEQAAVQHTNQLMITAATDEI